MYGEQLEIPVGTLLKRNAGCLKVFSDGTSFLKDLCEMIPKHQSAFDAALPALRAANDGILDETVPGVMGAVLDADVFGLFGPIVVQGCCGCDLLELCRSH